MKKISNYIGRTLMYAEPNIFKWEFELRSGDECIATISMPKLFSRTGVGKSEEGSWIFEQHGFFRRTSEVLSSDGGPSLATFKVTSWNRGGIITFADGRTLQLVRHGLKSRFEITTSTGEALVEFTSVGFFSSSLDVQIRHRASSLSELPWLVLFTLYLYSLDQRAKRAS